MTLEDLISNLKNDTLDLEIKICSLCDFYFDSGSYQKNAKIIANAHDDNQINLISLATQVIEELNKNELNILDLLRKSLLQVHPVYQCGN